MIQVLEGEQEVEIVRYLLRLYRVISRQKTGEAILGTVDAAQAEVMKIVNNFFYEKMTSLPTVREYINGLKT